MPTGHLAEDLALIAIARARTPEGDFRVGDMFALPFEDDSFDAATSFNGIWKGCEQALIAWAGAAGERFAPTIVPTVPLGLDLRSGEISTIVWATGYRPDLSWLDVPVLDRRGRVVHDGGVAACPGLYLIGMPFLRRRKSSLIDGAAADAAELTAHPAGHLDALAGRRERSAS